MEILYVVSHILLSIAISLGVGSSTLAIINFFVAIKDGTIEPAERRMMGNVYIVLRVAMIMILLTLTLMLFLQSQTMGGSIISSYTVAQFTLIFVLFLNAALMTMKKMPSTIGPALQASTWYTLGVLAALYAIDMVSFTPFQFLLGYITVFVLAVTLVNGMMAHLKKPKV